MTDRSIHMIFESSGMPIPSEEEVRFEAREMVRRNGWGVPIILAVKKIADPYWREAIARCLLEKWQQLLSNKDEQVFYYDGDGNGIYYWLDAESDFRRENKKNCHIIYRVMGKKRNIIPGNKR